MASTEAPTPTFAVLGAGLIGCYVGGRLLANGCKVSFLGRPYLQKQVEEAGGFTLTDLERKEENTHVPASEITVVTSMADLAKLRPTILLLCVKSGATESIARELTQYPELCGEDVYVVSIQNGLENVPKLKLVLEGTQCKVVAGTCTFNVASPTSGRFHRGSTGPLAFDDTMPVAAAESLRKAGFVVSIFNSTDMEASMRGKLVINLNNSINALAGFKLKQQLENYYLRNIVADLYEEALRVYAAAGLPVHSFTLGIPVLIRFMRMPDFLFGIVFKFAINIDPDATSSMYEDLQACRATEIKELNGVIVALGSANQIATPVNSLIVRLVEQAEAKKEGSPCMQPEVLYEMVQKVKGGQEV
eukprot:comp23101_c2_seq1/m.37147 comp23101_c2_seq1/g.37147  ORF comp23101_c2_seq1/g.37147 comp23101_c2_seq1/m.37147 type:complete len:361 (-) comp23101_c2_seq1:344-1426(-)